ncbi:MAG: hypothetical protein A2W93_03735 [Bacteroidetes bacterium GWF2_43_63]|nr:MAG: hypothetical protein A2W93_03735 [Bacteroidetes bacterium GWF2_43_63]HBG70540.1 hypothetical protein [Bacteroidales bacterium]HCB61536.1 hypothetical protein [Bacteroidales bacterium]
MRKLYTALAFLFLVFNSHAQYQSSFWGMTYAGGNGGGVVFKTNGYGDSLQVAYNFINLPGRNPLYSQLCEATNGKLYGMTFGGGPNDAGVLYEFDNTTGIFTPMVIFNGTTDGRNPYGSLTLAPNGKLYGMTQSGGASNAGVLFEYDPINSVFVKKIDLVSATTGRNPFGSLMLASNGLLYGLTSGGGASNSGVLFEFNPATGILIKKWDFDGTVTGKNPYGTLMQASNGLLYGMTFRGGTSSLGVLFEYNISTGTVLKKIDFTGAANGRGPYGSLTEYSNGMLYGMTAQGGTLNLGVLFEYNPVTSVFTKKIDFDGPLNGRSPYGTLINACGVLTGMTSGGGTNDKGVIFDFDPTSGILTRKQDFDGLTMGSAPFGSLMTASDGKQYGVTNSGGPNNNGVLFEYDCTTNSFAKKIDFAITVNGAYPYGSLIYTADNMLYGNTTYGGQNEFGVIFNINPIGNVFTKVLDYDNATNGGFPVGNMSEAANGKLYGMTYSGGINDKGTLYEFDPATGINIVKRHLDSALTGSYPYGSLIETSTGDLYGMTSFGGINDLGIIFQYNYNSDLFSLKHSFDGLATGANPYGDFVMAGNGKLYAMTYSGGLNDMGVLFEYDITSNTFTNKVDFAGVTNGANPYGSLTLASNGMLYGLTSNGGVSNMGVLFEFDPVNSVFTKKIDFTGIANGNDPEGTLLESSGGKLYGVTKDGGVNNLGVLFEFDPATGLLVKKFDFDADKGKNPYYTKLVEVCNAPEFVRPVSDASVCLGENTFFKSFATGNWLTYQWQVNPGAGFVNISDNSMYSGSQTDSLHLNAVPASMNNYLYRCIITSTCPESVVISNTAILHVRPHYEITENKETCDNESLFWRGDNYTLAGTYYDSLITQYGCDSVYVLNLIVHPTFEFDNYAEMCDNESFSWRGKTYFDAGTYYDSLNTIYGCDSVYILHLIEHPTYVTLSEAEVCDNQSYTWRGNTYFDAGTYYDNLNTVYGCDSVFVLNLIVHPTYVTPIEVEICDNESYTWRGETYFDAGTYYDSLNSMYGCDSVFILNLIVHPTYVTLSEVEVCDNESYTWRGNTYFAAGTYYDSLNTVYGCDSVFVLHLIVHPTFIIPSEAEVCDNQSYTWRGNTYFDAGTYYDSLNTIYGCDSIFVLHLIVHPTYVTPIEVEICDNESYTWRGETYFDAGIYYDSLNSMYGCDSVFILNLIVHPTYVTLSEVEVCDNESYTWRGETYFDAGIYYDSLNSMYGCDSVFVLHLIVHPTFVIPSEAEVCDNQSYTWRGNTYFDAGAYYDSLNTIYGCDSVFVLHLIVHPTFEYSQSAEICDNESYFWRGNTYYNAGTYRDSLTSIHGCDSVFILHIIVHPTFEFPQSAEICDNDVYTWRGKSLYDTGTYYDSLLTIYGCDSVYILNLLVHPNYETIHNAEICKHESYTWRGNTYASAGTYYDYLNTAFGCDSTFVLNLVVHPTYEIPQIVHICDNETYIWRGNILSNTGVYYDSLTTVHGCDSVYILALLVHPTFEFVQHAEICDNENFLWRGNLYQNTGIYYDSLNAAFGCDSVYVLDLKVHPTYEFVLNVEICDNESYLWRGNTYFNAGTYYENLNSVNGCDSIYILNLIVHPTYVTLSEVEICDDETYSWRGFTLDTTGIYYDSLTTQNGCDSVFILNLIVHPTYVILSEVEVCDNENYFWHGNTYTSTGTYYDSLSTTYGCDSIHVLHLIVNPTFEFSENAEICSNENYFWRGNPFNISGTYYDSLLTAHGCDSIYILNLNVKQAYEFTEYAEICDGGTYFWRGNNYNTSGIFYDSLQAQTGCDSLYVLDLIVHPDFVITDDTDICTGDVFSWHGNNYSTSGIYYDSLQTQYGCDSVHVLNLIVQPLPVVEINITDSVFCIYNPSASLIANPAGGTFSGQGMSGNIFDPAAAGIGTWPVEYTYTDTNGCQNSASVNIVVDDCAGIESLNDGNISIFPNPTSGQLTITFPAEDDYTLSFIDALGQIIQKEQISAQKTVQFDLNSVAPGVYMLKIENAEGYVLKRVVVER